MLKVNKSKKMPFNKDLMMSLYEEMLRIRYFEDECGRQYMAGNIQGFLHQYNGQEAIAVGTISLLNEQDYVVTHYRDHGHALARQVDSHSIMAELVGKSTGTSQGKGGSMHIFDVEKRFMGGYAIVGAQLPIAVGLALSIQYKGNDGLVICFLGDGAINEGEFHESMNLASIWKLPVLFVCENNLYGMGARVSETFAHHNDVYKVAEAYKIPSTWVDGMDLLKVRAATSKALTYIRGGKGPVFMEARCYRFRGHSIADPGDYRPDEEVKKWLERDPIVTFRAKLLQDETITAEQLEAIENKIEKEIIEAVRFAEESPWPEPNALFKEVYG